MEIEEHHPHHSCPMPPPAPHLHHIHSTICDLHPEEAFTGFCASCLRERFSGLEPSAATSGRKSTSALKSAFLRVAAGGSGGGGAGGGGERASCSASSFLRPSELRRCKSFSLTGGGGIAATGAGGGDSLCGAPAANATLEPRRSSCDVRGRSTLWSLFHKDDRGRSRECPITIPSAVPFAPASPSLIGGEVETKSQNLGFPNSSAVPPVPESCGQDEEGEIRPVDPVPVVGTSSEIEQCQMVAAEKEAKERTETKPMKDHISLDSQPHPTSAKKPSPKDIKEIAGSFWLAASVFSKKLQKWRWKQKPKKEGCKAAAAAMPTVKPVKSYRNLRGMQLQSEVAVDTFRRRSCDIDRWRFSLDAGRMSLDDPRFSFDEPRASWDGYLIGGGRQAAAASSQLHHHMVSVMEDCQAPPAVPRSDSLIPVEEDRVTPGGSAQTRDYYIDSSSRRRWSLDRSSSSVLREQQSMNIINDPKLVSNAKVTPAVGAELFHSQSHHRSSLINRDPKGLSSNSLSLGDDYLADFELAPNDPPQKKVDAKKLGKWSKAWNIWGLIHRRGSNKGGGGGGGGADLAERSFSENWPELQTQAYNRKFVRSNSTRNSLNNSSSWYRSMRRATSGETNGHNKKRTEEFALERNRSARSYSPSHADNGMLRFYLTPARSSRRKGGSGNGRLITSHYITRSIILSQ